MATTKNTNADLFNFDGEEKPLLDKFPSILDNVEHVSISDNDMLIYVHEKSHCYNLPKITTGTNYSLRQKALAKIEVEGGQSCVC
jgi:hypothetical protein